MERCHCLHDRTSWQHTTHLRHLHSWHAIDVETEDLRAIVADHKALHLLLVYREVASLDVKVPVAREAQHVLTLGVPGHAVSIRFLQREQKKRRRVKVGSGGNGLEVIVEHRPGRSTWVKYVPVLKANNYTHTHISILFHSTATLKCILKSAILASSAIHFTLSTASWPEKAVLYYWCHRPGECCAHPPQPVYCGRRSCPGSALTLTASAVWWETGCQQISSGSTSQKQWPAEHDQNRTSVLMLVKSIYFIIIINVNSTRDVFYDLQSHLHTINLIFFKKKNGQIPGPLASEHEINF